MSLHDNDVCLLEVDDYNLYEEEASDHAFTRYGHPAWSLILHYNITAQSSIA